MKSISLLLISCILFAINIFAQTEDLGVKYANTITSSELKEHLSVLAGDYFEGRETGTKDWLWLRNIFQVNYKNQVYLL